MELLLYLLLLSRILFMLIFKLKFNLIFFDFFWDWPFIFVLSIIIYTIQAEICRSMELILLNLFIAGQRNGASLILIVLPKCDSEMTICSSLSIRRWIGGLSVSLW